MKIVRVMLNVEGDKFFLDRKFDEAKADFDNCDSSMQFLTETCAQNKTLAVMKLTQGAYTRDEAKKDFVFDQFYGALPAIINIANIRSIIIESVGVYEQPDQPPAEVRYADGAKEDAVKDETPKAE